MRNLIAFIARPGKAALANGAVASGIRSGSANTAVSVDANTTYWQGTPTSFSHGFHEGKIDAKESGGVVDGQITIGIVASALTPNGKLTLRIRNTGGIWTTILALTAAIALSTTELYKTYDLPYLLTTPDFNAVPFEVSVGVQSDSATNTATARIMESSWISGEFAPGT